MKISREWPVAEHTAATLQEAMVEAGAARVAALEAELQSAQKAEDARSLLESARASFAGRRSWTRAAARLAALPRLEKNPWTSCGPLLPRLRGWRAGHITGDGRGRTDVEIAVQEDYGPEEQKKLARARPSVSRHRPLRLVPPRHRNRSEVR